MIFSYSRFSLLIWSKLLIKKPIFSLSLLLASTYSLTFLLESSCTKLIISCNLNLSYCKLSISVSYSCLISSILMPSIFYLCLSQIFLKNFLCAFSFSMTGWLALIFFFSYLILASSLEEYI